MVLPRQCKEEYIKVVINRGHCEAMQMEKKKMPKTIIYDVLFPYTSLQYITYIILVIVVKPLSPLPQNGGFD